MGSPARLRRRHRMDPGAVRRGYNALAVQWDESMASSEYGLGYLARAVAGAPRGWALDVGCGSGGRFPRALLSAGFTVHGIDVADAMIALAARRHPESTFDVANVVDWRPAHAYALVVAWDSLFHVALSRQEHVVRKLCRALAPGGRLLLTVGGRHGEFMAPMRGQSLYYASLAPHEYLEILSGEACRCLLYEQDQLPEQHAIVIACREPAPSTRARQRDGPSRP